ncbi:MAG: hypothetical protein DRP76_01330 [Candidatus Omnitrophota bacterium]|nr:MAG: hypothetical protein DRP76_01330 [Candidatus Omnitrophota bacterium]
MLRKVRSFTLIELIMVIVIIGILAAIAIPRFINLRRDARRAACQGSLGTIRAALTNYYSWYSIHSAHYNGYYPDSINDLAAYFQGGAVPDDPGWLAGEGHVPAGGATWDTWYTSGTIGVMSGNACCINNF